MLKVNLFCVSETAPAKYEGTARNDAGWFAKKWGANRFIFNFYFKHGLWKFELCGFPMEENVMEGFIGHDEEDDMNKLVARSIIVYSLATITGETDIEVIEVE